jgi:hypothetical protein
VGRLPFFDRVDAAFVLYSFSGLAIAVVFVATIFTEKPEKTNVRVVRVRPARRTLSEMAARAHDPVEAAVNVTSLRRRNR